MGRRSTYKEVAMDWKLRLLVVTTALAAGIATLVSFVAEAAPKVGNP